MALTFPYSLDFLSDRLRTKKVSVNLERFDQTHAINGRVWTEQLGTPLWKGELTLADRVATLAQDLEARIDGLDGSRGTFFFADPTYPGPASGPYNWTGINVTVASIRADRGAITLAGLPANFVLTVRDRFTILYPGGRVYMGRFLEDGTAGSEGNIQIMKEIRPYLPQTVSVGASVVMVRPYFKAFIPPGGFTPFEYDLPHGEIARGGTLRIQQRP